MKRSIAICLIIFACAALVWSGIGWARSTVVVAVSGVPVSATPPSYVFEENFEGAGAENTWTTEGDGTYSAVPDYTTTVLRGSNSLYMSSGASAYADYYCDDFTAQDEAWFFFRFRFAAAPASAYTILRVQATGDSAQLEIVLTDGRQLVLTMGSNQSDLTGALSIDTTYYIWGYYKKGTGANAEGWLRVGTSTTMPGSNTISMTNGTTTADVVRLKFSVGAYTGAHSFILDQIIVHSSAIGDVSS